MELNNEEALEFLNRLLDRLRQAGFNANGSHLQLVYVAPGAQHVETQVIASPWPPSKRGGNAEGREKGTGNLPEVLATEKAMALWEKARTAGYVDANYQPQISRTQAALLADMMAERLGIRDKWKVFERLWNRNNMYRDYYQAFGQRKTLAFQDELKKMFR